METLLAELPVFDGTYFLKLVSRILHIAGAIVLVGGIAYLRKVVVPACTSEGDVAEQLYAGRRKTWAKWVGITTVLLLASGICNLIHVMKGNPDLPGAYHWVLLLKLILALVVFFLAAVLAGKTSAADSFRNSAKKWFTICLAAGLTIVVLAGVLRSLHLPPSSPEVEAKADKTEPPKQMK